MVGPKVPAFIMGLQGSIGRGALNISLSICSFEEDSVGGI